MKWELLNKMGHSGW
ncbi:hypothetical protein PWA37_004625 [Arxiozyma heterogenica]